MLRRAVLASVAVGSALTASPAAADHVPRNDDELVWKDLPGADFNLEILWTPGYKARGPAFQQRVRDVVAQDPSCFTNTCTTGTYARWYLDRAHPYFGGTASDGSSDFDPFDKSLTAVERCGTLGAVSFHWRQPPNDVLGRVPLAAAVRCDYLDDPTRTWSAHVAVNPDPPPPSAPDGCAPGPYTWFTAGPGEPGDGAMPCRTYDLMSVLAHEVGHVLGLGHLMRADAECGYDSDRETMCEDLESQTKRQRTPEEHEKAALRNLYPPTGPPPSISPSDHIAEGGVGKWTVTVPRDPNRATTLQMVYGDGTWDARSIPQGSGTTSFAISHPFPGVVTYTQRATIVETGAFAQSTTTRKIYPLSSCSSPLNVANRVYTMTGNLSCSIADAGINITANGVTLDLNGFTISGVPYPVIEDKPGVLLDNVTGARVTDSTTTATSFGRGTISNFDAGVAIVGGSANTVDKLNIVDNKSMELGWWGSGVHIEHSNNNVVIDNKVLRNGPLAGVGVYEEEGESSGNVIGKTSGASPLKGGNIISDNSQTVSDDSSSGVQGGVVPFDGRFAPVNQDDGVRLEPGADNNTVENNTIENNGLDGIALFFGGVDGDKTSGNVIKGNRINNNGHHLLRHRKGDGIRVFGPNATQNADNNYITANRVCGNAASGIRVDGGRKWNNAALSWVGTKNRVQNNVAGNTATGCANNVAHAASSRALNWDLYDHNVLTNVTFGHPPCDSNAWNANTTTGTVNHSCVLAP